MYRRILLGPTEELILDYISSLEQDKLIVCEVLEVLEAHVSELRDSNSIPPHLAEEIAAEVRALKRDPSSLFSTSAEDVHEAIEMHMRERLGEKAGYLALGRSRNDHVAAALRLKVARLLLEELRAIASLRKTVLSRAREHLGTFMPVYTHLYPAQVSTFAHYLLCVDELLSTYAEVLLEVLDLTARSPLGSGPAAGVATPVSRERLALKLFGGRLVHNTLYATSSRDFLLLALAVNASFMVSLSRVVEDLIILSTPHVGYLSLPPEHLATSSIMPHKKNPATLEVARAKAGEVLGCFVAAASIVKGLPSGYNLDLQEANGCVVRVLGEIVNTLRILNDVVLRLEVNAEAMRRDIFRFPVLASDIAELIALKTGRPFREVYEEMAKLIGECGDTEEFYNAVEERYGINLEVSGLVRRPVAGSPNPDTLIEYIEKAEEEIGMLLSRVKSVAESLPEGCRE